MKILKGPFLPVAMILAVMLACPLVPTTHAQTSPITVSQQFLDDANAAFREVVALRTANDALIKADAANRNAILALTSANDTLKADNADLRKLKCDQTSFLIFVIRIKRCK